MHHSLVDGAGGSSFMTALHDLEAVPSPDNLPIQDEPLLVDRTPSTSELLGRAGINRIKNTVSLVRGTAGLTRDLGSFALKLARKEIPMPDVQSPKSRFNNAVGPHRVFDATDFALAEFKMIKDATGVKLNDVALAIVGGALQRYLVSKGETPEASLAGSLPVNMRTRRGETDDNNQVGAIFASLHTDIEDPIERLKAVHASTVAAKEFGETSPMVDALKIAGVFSPAFSKAAASLWADRELSRFIPANTSTVITNVPGPNFDLFCAGARMVQYHGLGVLTPGVGLFHTVFSQSDRVNMSVLADRDSMPDPSFYIECLQQSYDEMLTAVQKLTGAKANTSKTTAKAKTKAKVKAKTKAAPKVKAKAKVKVKAKAKPKAKAKAKAKTKAKAKATASKKPVAKKPVAKKAPVKAIRARRKPGGVAPKLKVVSG
jgi:diacylglycerol O-acyltransferase